MNGARDDALLAGGDVVVGLDVVVGDGPVCGDVCVVGEACPIDDDLVTTGLIDVGIAEDGTAECGTAPLELDAPGNADADADVDAETDRTVTATESDERGPEPPDAEHPPSSAVTATAAAMITRCRTARVPAWPPKLTRNRSRNIPESGA